MKTYKVQLKTATVTIKADRYFIEKGGTLAFYANLRGDEEGIRAFNRGTWHEVWLENL